MPLLVDHTAPFSDILLEVWSKHELIWRLRMFPLTEKRISTRERVGSGDGICIVTHEPADRFRRRILLARCVHAPTSVSKYGMICLRWSLK
jgi:hypothetical protein